MSIEVGVFSHSRYTVEEIECIVGDLYDDMGAQHAKRRSCRLFEKHCLQSKQLKGHIGVVECRNTKWVRDPVIHVYRLFMEGRVEDVNEEEQAITSLQWALPSWEFRDLWHSLVYDTNVKEDILTYATTAMSFSDHNVNPSIISWNKVILLHGPPGTGKTTLCKAIAQKLSIRFSKRYTHGRFIEVNSHSLFSKWFSESGKLVGKMFQSLRELVEKDDCFVFILIDEVESLAAARSSLSSGSEPSDAVRVVNALLTQIDQLKSYPNVLVMTTSNLSERIDIAFIDRADMKFFIDVPGEQARYQILSSCLTELARAGLLPSELLLLDYASLEAMEFTASASTATSLSLLAVAKTCQGFSGRVLRKLPCLAYSIHCESQKVENAGGVVRIEDYIRALQLAVENEHQQRRKLTANCDKVL